MISFLLVFFFTGESINLFAGKLLKWAEPSKLHDQQLLVALTIGLAFGWSGASTLLGFDGFLLIFVGGIVYLLLFLDLFCF